MSICRRKFDEEHGNPWICECPLCREVRRSIESPEGRKEMDDKDDDGCQEEEKRSDRER